MSTPTALNDRSPWNAGNRMLGRNLQRQPVGPRRTFFKRTKTGCLPCRRRKKKCDETQPTCKNCFRNGLQCVGYPPKRELEKKNSETAVPFQSQDLTYVPPGASVMSQQSAHGSQPIEREYLPPDHSQAIQIHPQQGYPLDFDYRLVDPNLQQPSLRSGEEMAREYQRMSPLCGFDKMDPVPTHTPEWPPRPTFNPQEVAQLALLHSEFSSGQTQKEETLPGHHFYPFDKRLERERCSAAVWSFNNLSGISLEERARLFREILQPRDPVRVSPTEASPITDIDNVGNNIVVERPFACDYGYNITIGDKVNIGRNCTINDVDKVKIGENCIISPNVIILTTDSSVHHRNRQRSQDLEIGEPVTIKQDCWIGAGVIILPGITIGEGSTVGAGSIVQENVEPFTVVAGNPAKFLRSIVSPC